MSNTVLDFMSLESVTKSVQTLGNTLTYIIEGSPGIGKTSILKSLPFKQFRIDCTVIQDSANLLFPFPNQTEKTMEFVLIGMLKGLDEEILQNRPVSIMVDELAKAPKLAQDSLITLLRERYIDKYKLPEGSYVFATANLSEDRVGDRIESHVYNGCTTLRCFGPSKDSWIKWAAEQSLHPVLIAWVHQTPELFDNHLYSHTGINIENNHFIYNPKRINTSKFFCSPRSLANVSKILQKMDYLTPEELQANIAGTIGKAAAAALSVFIENGRKLPSLEEIQKNPETTPLVQEELSIILAISLAINSNKTSVEPFLVYLDRFSNDEPKAMFCSLMHHNKSPGLWGFLQNSKRYEQMTQRVSDLNSLV